MLRAVALPGPCPALRSVPPVIGETHPIIRIVDVLPAPFGPRNPNDSPGATSKSMASTAVNSPKRLGQPAGMDERASRPARGSPAWGRMVPQTPIGGLVEPRCHVPANVLHMR